MSSPAPRRRRRSASRAAGPPEEHAAIQQPADQLAADQLAADQLAKAGPIDGPYVTDVVDREDRRRRKRQRYRSGSPDGPVGEAADDRSESATGSSTGAAAHPWTPPENPAVIPPAETRRSNDSRRSDRGLRGLEASRSSQLTPNQAMRAREFARPTADDLADAEQELVVVRRNYIPPTPLQSSRRRDRRRDEDGSTPGS